MMRGFNSPSELVLFVLACLLMISAYRVDEVLVESGRRDLEGLPFAAASLLLLQLAIATELLPRLWAL